MRTLSTIAREAMFAQETDRVFLILLTITHPELAVTIRVVNNPENIVSRGDTFLAAGFTIALPDETDQGQPRVQLQVDNVDRAMVAALRSITVAPSVVLEVILASSPDTVEAGPFNFSLRSADYTAETILGELMYEDLLNEAFPAGSFDPSRFVGLF